MKLKYVDVLRGIAVLGVLIVHCSYFGNNLFFPKVVKSFFENGAMGVQLFFFTSAFTLFLSMNKRINNEKLPIINFFIRRFFRIAPIYYLGILYYLLVIYLKGDFKNIDFYNVISNLLFLNGFNPYWINSVVPGGWSIAVEMLFYCLVPFLFVKIKNTQHAFVFVIITLFIRTIFPLILNNFNLIGHDKLSQEYLFYYLPNQLPIFALGILFYFIVKENYKIAISPVLIIFTSFVLIGQFSNFSILILPSHFIFGISFVLLGIAMSKFEFKLLINPILIYIGKISYSMYLVHFVVLFWLNKLRFIDYLYITNTYSALLNFSIRLILLISISFIFANLLYKLIELPMQKLGGKLIERLNKQNSINT